MRLNIPTVSLIFLPVGVALVAVRLFGNGLLASAALPLGAILLLLGVGAIVGEAAKDRGLKDTDSTTRPS